MKKFFVALFLLVWIRFGLFSQERVLATDVQRVEIEERIRKESALLSSLVCDFEQKKFSELFKKEEVLMGKMYYQHSDGASCGKNVSSVSLRWDYDGGYSMIYQDGIVNIRSADGKSVNNYKTNRWIQGIFDIVQNVVNGVQTVDRNQFDVKIYIDNDYCYYVLIPIQKMLKSHFECFELVFSLKDYTGYGVNLLEGNGDVTSVRFKNIQRNVSISKEKFQ